MVQAEFGTRIRCAAQPTTTSIVARHRVCHNFAPFKDSNPAAHPDQRYKALGGTGEPGLIAFVSADGIRWQELQPEPVITQGAFDSQNVAFWSESEQQYVCYFRVFRRNVRWISRSTSPDFVHWSEPVDLAVRRPASHNTFIRTRSTPYLRAPHIYLGMPTRFFPGRRALTDDQIQSLGRRRNGTTRMIVRTLCSRQHEAVTSLDRTFMEALIRPGLDPRNWTSRANYAARGIVQTEPERIVLLCESQSRLPHGPRPPLHDTTRWFRFGQRALCRRGTADKDVEL